MQEKFNVIFCRFNSVLESDGWDLMKVFVKIFHHFWYLVSLYRCFELFKFFLIFWHKWGSSTEKIRYVLENNGVTVTMFTLCQSVWDGQVIDKLVRHVEVLITNCEVMCSS